MDDDFYQDLCNEGYEAYHRGTPEHECPYIENSDEGEAWYTGFAGAEALEQAFY